MNLKVKETFHSFTHLNFASASSTSINEIPLFTFRKSSIFHWCIFVFNWLWSFSNLPHNVELRKRRCNSFLLHSPNRRRWRKSTQSSFYYHIYFEHFSSFGVPTITNDDVCWYRSTSWAGSPVCRSRWRCSLESRADDQQTGVCVGVHCRWPRFSPFDPPIPCEAPVTQKHRSIH